METCYSYCIVLLILFIIDDCYQIARFSLLVFDCIHCSVSQFFEVSDTFSQLFGVVLSLSTHKHGLIEL